jgi:hypothetical protein
MSAAFQGYAVVAFSLASLGVWLLPPSAGKARDGGQRPWVRAFQLCTPTPTLPHRRGREQTDSRACRKLHDPGPTQA